MLTDRERATVLAALRYWQRMTTQQQRHDRTFQEHLVVTDAGKIEPLTDAEIDALCQRLKAPGPSPRYVLYDFDADELATTLIYGSHAEAQEDADQFDNVVVITLALPAAWRNGTTESESLAGPIPHLSILTRLTGVSTWRELAGPESGCGLDYWYASADGRSAYINIDQDHITVSIDGECIYGGSLSDLNIQTKGG